MSDKDFELLLKMLGMTGSDNDNQALVAMRKANDLASKLGGWDSILRGKVKITILADPFANINLNKAKDAYSPTPPPRPQAPPPPPPPTYSAAYRQPNKPSSPAFNMGRGRAASSGQNQQQQPKAESNPIPNKFEGTCTTCKTRVLPGAGLAYRSGGRWMTRHNPGQCPSTGKKTFTTDNLQI